MITLFIIGMVVLTVKLVALTLSVTWGLTKTILFGVGLPVILAALFIAGLTAFAVPLLILVLLGVFLLPLFGICGSGCRGVHGMRQRVCPDFVQKGD